MPAERSFRNFAIIAHVDHGKSTLADRFIEHCGALTRREMRAQVLDSMEVERERGITVKAQSVSLDYRAASGREYRLNLIDTPGHVDFAYEVSSALNACEGAILLVDATQGVQAQTVANCFTALELDLTIIPVLNKIDLPAAEPEQVAREIEQIIGLDCSDILSVSAKSGEGVDALLERLVETLPPPQGSPDDPLRVLLLDSWFDNYLGVTGLVRVVDGTLRGGKMPLVMLSNGRDCTAEQIGMFTPKATAVEALPAGAVGFVVMGLKETQSARVGDTLTSARAPAEHALPGFREIKPAVFAGLYPLDGADFPLLRQAMERLSLNDAALHFETESSPALGFGFRCGFLGLLHMEVVRERLGGEFGCDLITTAPTVLYRVECKSGETLTVDNPSNLPDPTRIERILEPFIQVRILLPADYVGAVLELCVARRGEQRSLDYHERQVLLEFALPLAEVVMDFHPQIKSASRGYGSLDYEPLDYREAQVVRVDILINGELVPPLAQLMHREASQRRARELVTRLKSLIPRQLFEVAIQAAIGGKIIARETVSALRKNVTAKCYGGDVSRKRKLLEKQKAGKKRMKQIGAVEIPQSAFFAALQRESD